MDIYSDLNYRLNEVGIEHCFVDWSDWEEIKDDKFHKLRKAYIKAMQDLTNYAKENIEEGE